MIFPGNNSLANGLAATAIALLAASSSYAVMKTCVNEGWPKLLCQASGQFARKCL